MTNSTDIDVLILANHSGGELAQLCRGRSVASLSISGRTILQYALEALSDCHPTTIRLAVAGDVPHLRDFISSGERWGVNAQVLSTQLDMPCSRVLARQPVQRENPLLVVPADRLYTTPLDVTIDYLTENISGKTRALQCSTTGVFLLAPGASMNELCTVDIEGADCRQLESIADFHALCLEVGNGQLSQMRRRGRQVAVGLRHGYQTRIHPCSVESGHTFSGNHCHVHPTARLIGQVVLNHRVRIGRMTRVENTVVLDDTVIGDHLTVRNAVVSGGNVHQIDTGTHLEVSDTFIMSDQSTHMRIGALRSPLNRLAGYIGCVAAFPLITVIAGIRFVLTRQNPFEQISYIGNRRDGNRTPLAFTTWKLDSRSPLLASLPMLKDVAAGHLYLIGVSPLTLKESVQRREDWQRVRDDAAVGLFGPTQRDLGLDADLDSKLISDALFTQADTGLTDRIKMLLTSLIPRFAFHSRHTSPLTD